MSGAKAELLALLAEKERRVRAKLLDTLYPEMGELRRALYPKHLAFFRAGARYRERCMMAANRIGKSYGAGGYEMVLHLTGLYPAWWEGRRFDHPVMTWAAGESSKTTRDTIQKILLGEPNHHGTGLIPADLIVNTTPKSGIANGIEDVYVRHVSGGISHIGLKSYEQGAGSFMGTERHVVWFDEEPPLDVYTEGLTRTMIVPGASIKEKITGMIIATFTPLNGLSDVVINFMPDGTIPEKEMPGEKFIIQVTWDEVPHLTKEMKDSLWASLPPHERNARAKGTPQLGAGAIYPIDEEEIICHPFDLPSHWPKWYALDVGWNKTAALWHAWDRESDTVYAYSEHYQGQASPADHAQAIKARGLWIPGVIDPASRGRHQKDGDSLLMLYEDLGLKLSVANNAIEAGIYQVWTRLLSGRYKIFSHLNNWRAEFRIYRRDKHGKVAPKQKDHLMDCSRYGLSSGFDIAATIPRDEDDYQPMREQGRSKVCGY